MNAVIEIPLERSQQVRVRQEFHVFGWTGIFTRPSIIREITALYRARSAGDGDPLECWCLSTRQASRVPDRSAAHRNAGDARSGQDRREDPRRRPEQPALPGCSKLSEIYPHMLREIQHFFATYKDLEGKRTEMIGWHNAHKARTVIVESHMRYVHASQSGQPARMARIRAICGARCEFKAAMRRRHIEFRFLAIRWRLTTLRVACATCGTEVNGCGRNTRREAFLMRSIAITAMLFVLVMAAFGCDSAPRQNQGPLEVPSRRCLVHRRVAHRKSVRIQPFMRSKWSMRRPRLRSAPMTRDSPAAS